MEWITKLLDGQKVPTKIIGLVCFISLVLIYGPDGMMEKLALMDFKKNYGTYLGIVFLASSGLFIINISQWIYNKYRAWQLHKREERKMEDAILNLDYQEKAVLREYCISNLNTLKVPINDPIVSALISKKILYRVSLCGEVTSLGVLFSCAISDRADRYLTLSILDLPDSPTKEEEIMINKSRPSWAVSLEADKRFHESRLKADRQLQDVLDFMRPFQ